MKRTEKNSILFNTIFQGFKRGVDPLSPMKVHDSVVDHGKNLRSPPRPLNPETREQFQRYFSELTEDPCSRCWSDYSKHRACSPLSVNGSFDYGRSKYGSLNELLHLFNLDEFDPEVYFSRSHRIIVFEDDHRALTSASYTRVTDETLEDLWYDYVQHTPTGKGAVRPAFILEPMKVRTITKGDCLTSSFLSKIQRWMHRNLSVVPGDVFQYVRESLEEEPYGLEALLNNRVLPFVVSGDFKGATDTVSMIYSEFVFGLTQEVAEQHLAFSPDSLKERLRWQMARRSLLGNVVVVDETSYPNDDLIKPYGANWKMPQGGYSYQQTNGQLMGSIISFPILCLINFFCYRQAVEEYLGGEPMLWKDVLYNYPEHNCKIVGDDIIFRSDERLYALWVKYIHQAGFVLSAGKNYISQDFGLFCSKLYDLSSDLSFPRPGGHRFIPFGNIGLIYDRSKTSHDPLDLRSIDKMSEECPTKWKSRLQSIPVGVFDGRLTQRFLSRHYEKLRELKIFDESIYYDDILRFINCSPTLFRSPLERSKGVVASSLIKKDLIEGTVRRSPSEFRDLFHRNVALWEISACDSRLPYETSYDRFTGVSEITFVPVNRIKRDSLTSVSLQQ